MAEKTAKNIYQRMAAITADLGTVAKDLTVSTGKSGSYKGVSERAVLDAVKPLEEKHGVYSYPHTRVPLASEWLEQEGQFGKKLVNFMRLETLYRFVNVDDPTDYVEMVAYGDGIDSGDKATGKAMTYSDKYALMKAYKISTGDDPDQEASGTYSHAPKSETKREPARPMPPEPASRSTEPTTGDKLLGNVKVKQQDLTELYQLAYKVSGVNAEALKARIREVYQCEPEDMTMDALLDIKSKFEALDAAKKKKTESGAVQQ